MVSFPVVVIDLKFIITFGFISINVIISLYITVAADATISKRRTKQSGDINKVDKLFMFLNQFLFYFMLIWML